MARRILYVEDDRATLDAVAQVLTLEGYEIEGAEDGIEAIRRIYRNPPHLILLDLMLPRMNGYQVCRLIKSDPNLAGMPVIALTAKSSEEDEVRGILTGADEYIVKPFDVEDLLVHIDAWFSRMGAPEDRQWTDPFAGKGKEEILSMILSRVNRELDEQLFEVQKLRREQNGLLKSLSDSERKYRELVEHSRDVIFRLDLEGNYRLVSPAVEQLTGYTPEEFYADRMLGCEIVLAEDVEKAQQGFQTASGGDIAQDIEYRIRGKDGGISWVLQTTFPIHDGEGQIVAIEGTLRDITERKRAEEALREAEEKSRVQERLAAVGQLAAGIAHDFNNLLTGIIGYAQLLKMRTDVSAQAKGDLTNIETEGQRAAHLIRQILDFSRKSIIQRQPLDLNSFLKESLKFLRRILPESIHIALHIGPEMYPVNADPAQIQDMLANLSVNARDAMPEGGELRFRLSRFILGEDDPPPLPEMSPGEWVVLSVSDTGTGIAPEHRPHIFEPFFTTKEAGEGTGLGLAQVYGIVMQHEGFIDLKSEVNRGTTFLIYLPVVREEKESAEEASEEVSWGQGEGILVVEDDPGVLALIRDMLESLGYRVLTAGNGEEALGVYGRHRDDIELVLTDMVMTGMDGAELFYVLRRQNPDVRVVVMTGYPLRDQGEKLLSQGIVAWEQKPMDLVKLMKLVNEGLRIPPEVERGSL